MRRVTRQAPEQTEGGDTSGQREAPRTKDTRGRGGSGRGSGRQLRNRERRDRLRLELLELERRHSPDGCAEPVRPDPQHPWGGQRSDETLLTGDTASKVEQAAEAKVPNGTVVRVETDADGNAAYEAHMTKADGTPVTVYVNEQFEVVSVESR